MKNIKYFIVEYKFQIIIILFSYYFWSKLLIHILLPIKYKYKIYTSNKIIKITQHKHFNLKS